MAPLTGAQRRHLRALGHHLKPVVIVGENGVTPALITQVETQLLAHELIKVKAHEGNRLEMKTAAAEISEGAHAEIAQLMGHTILLYKRRENKPSIELP